MKKITDEYMKQRIASANQYTAIILRNTPKASEADAKPIIWEHGRRNFQLQTQGLFPIICPITDGSDVSGVGVFNASLEETKKIMDQDPGVKAGLFTYELHVCRGFPGSTLPEAKPPKQL